MKQGNIQYDAGLFFLALIITILGLFFIFDAGYARSILAQHGMIPREFRGQIIFLIVSLFFYGVCHRIDLSIWKKISKFLFYATFISLIAVELPGIGKEMNGARRWIGAGPFLIQPSEFMKISILLYLASVFSIRKRKLLHPKVLGHWVDQIDKKWIPFIKRTFPAILVLMTAYLIERERDLGTAAVVIVISFATMLVGGVSKKSIFLGTLFGVIGVVFLVTLEPYRMERITHHGNRWNPETIDGLGYQTTHSETAMAGGGVFGVGIGAGRAKHMLPAATTDFIMATIGEEFGLIGVLLMVGLMGWLSLKLVLHGMSSEDLFAKLILLGTATWLGIQSCVNLMMANGTLPAIGIPFPLISSGGSSLIATWVAIGICQSALKQTAKIEERRKRHEERKSSEKIDYNRGGDWRSRLSGTGSRT